MTDQILPKESPVSVAPETTQESNGQEIVQKLTSRELIAAKLKRLSAPEAADNEDNKLRNRGLAESLSDIDASLAPEIDGDKVQEPAKLDLISAYQGLGMIKESYGQDSDVDTIQQSVLERLKQEHKLEDEELDYLDLDLELETSLTQTKESINKGAENMSVEEAAKAAANVEMYLKIKQEIKTKQQEILGDSKSFYSEISKKTADHLIPYFSATGKKFDETLSVLPDIAILRAAKNLGEEGKMTDFSRRAALATGALAGLAFFAGRPGTIEAASHMESALTGGDTLHPLHTEVPLIHETRPAETITQEISHEAGSSPEVSPTISDVQSQQEKIELQSHDNNDQIVNQEIKLQEENGGKDQSYENFLSKVANFLKGEDNFQREVFDLYKGEEWEELSQDAKANFILMATESANDFWKPEMALSHLHEYITHPLAQQILEKAVERGVMVSPHIDMFAGMPWAKDILKAEIDKTSDDNIQIVKRELEMAWYSPDEKAELLSYINDKFPPPTLEQAFDKFHQATSTLSKVRFSNLYWPRLAEETRAELIDKVMETNQLAGGDLIFDNFNDLKENPKLKDWLKEVEDSAPEIIVNNFIKYRNFPWGRELAAHAIVNAPPELTLNNSALMHPGEEDWVKPNLEHAYPGSIQFLELYKHGPEFSYTEFSKDPALQLAVRVNTDWIPTDDVDKNNNRETLQQRLLVARNLYFNEVSEITPEAVQKASHEIIEARDKYKDVPLFEGRNVLIAAHGETVSLQKFPGAKEQWRFGKQAVLEEIKHQQYGGDNPSAEGELKIVLERPSEQMTRDEVLQVKQRVLDSIRTLPNLTFLFDGHGSPHGLFFAEGEADKVTQIPLEWNHISPLELARAFIDRYQNLSSEHDDSAKKPIIILASCYNSNYLRNFYELLDKANVPKPISMGESEFGQLGYSQFDIPEGSKFFKYTILQPGTEKSTIGGVIGQDDKVYGFNPSLFIPGPGNRLMQISEKEQGEQTMPT